MPHSVSDVDSSIKIQAIILCGPGVSFTTFASKPDKYPKALLPIANKPMVWYVLDLCRRMGIKDVTLIVPPSSEDAMCRAVETNPYLTSLPHPPRLLAPEGLEQTTGTASIFRLPAVRKCIVTDFVVLPCDLICELDGMTILRTWLSHQKLSGVSTYKEDENVTEDRGGFTMWYDTKQKGSITGEETDFMMTTPIPTSLSSKSGTTMASTAKLVQCMPTDTLNDIIADNQGELPIRRSLVKKYPHTSMLTHHRDAHLYIFPYWVLDMINANKDMLSLAEDVLGCWAKAEWQIGLGDKLGLRKIFKNPSTPNLQTVDHGAIKPDGYTGEDRHNHQDQEATTAEDVPEFDGDSGDRGDDADDGEPKTPFEVPSIIAYVHRSGENSPLVRRVDTAPLLLSISLMMARLPSIEEVGQAAASPFAHQVKIAAGAVIEDKCVILKSNCLIGEKVKVKSFCNFKDSVIGANCTFGKGVHLLRCVLMDGAVVEDDCRLTNCIIGHKAIIGNRSILNDCEVQDDHKVEPKTKEKGEKIMEAKGLEEGFGDGDDLNEENASLEETSDSESAKTYSEADANEKADD